MIEEHLDAEVVAAWADGSLDPQVRAAAEAHTADCTRCQAVLAAMVRTEPAAAQPGRGWLGARVRWLVPLAAAAAAVALWVGVSNDVPAPGTPPQIASRAEPVPDEAARAVPTPTLAVPPPRDAATREISPDESRRRPDSAAPPAARTEAPRQAEKPAAAPGPVRLDELRRDPSAGAAPPSPGRSEKPAALPPVPVPTESVLTPTQTQTQTQTQVGPTQTQSAQSQTPATETVLARRAAFSTNTALGDVASPDPAVRYRVGMKGSIQRSADGGKTWVAQTSPVTLDLFAASAPSPEVCWIVGRSGVVLLTTDGGATWRRVPFPQPSDLRQIEATDARTATVTTLDGRVFRTFDGGVTWQR